MPKYVNTRTGAVVETASVCHGEDWEELKPAEKKPPKKTPTKKTQKKEKEVKKNG